MGEYLLLRSWA